MFDTDRFIEECRVAIVQTDAQDAIREAVAKAVSDPAQLMKALGEPRRAGVFPLYKAADLTILNLCWGPGMDFQPHNHRMWAVIGIYTGREQNSFYRRTEGGLVRHGTKELNGKETIPLGKEIIHSVTNPLDRITGAIHVYGGDFFGTARSEWDPQTFEERPYSVENTVRAFEASNARLR